MATCEVKYMTLPHQGGEHRVCYEDWAPAAGSGGGDDAPSRCVVCVHGLTRNKGDFRKLAQHLSAKGLR